MTLKWFRARAFAIAPVLLAMLAALVVPHVGDSHHESDVDFAPLVAHDESAHRIGNATSDDEEQPLHCAICHWSRSVRPLIQIVFRASSTTEAIGLVLVDAFAAADSGRASQPPLRSPPASPARA